LDYEWNFDVPDVVLNDRVLLTVAALGTIEENEVPGGAVMQANG
jgi:hypothetical protein